MLHTLPTPGTPHFAKLTSALQPFGVGPRGITFEAPSARMADIALNFELVGGAVRLQITYEGFEIVVSQLQEEHLTEIPKLARIARETLQDCSPASTGGRYEITYSAHLALEPGKAVSILAEHLPSEAKDQELAPDAFAYRIQQPDRPEVVELRLFVAQSLLLKEGVWVQFIAVYQGELPVERLAQQAVDDTSEALARLGLKNPRGDTK
ncbi:MAG: hypothetical protein AAB225_20775 [Acidobacteriota bacterium]